MHGNLSRIHLCPGRKSSQLSNQFYFVRRLTFLCPEQCFSGWNFPPLIHCDLIC
uniref:Uncharacterized protein n=1 Tax=Caudovirales sp. ct7964 TaxID=2825758 RepID=A0A8S5PH01_9CAUD|nr:MAG TPA: hypothetical protein [Caudovirales sp. ct7964]